MIPPSSNTAFWIQASRGLTLWVVAVALAFPFAAFYKEPQVKMLIIAGAFSVAIRGVTSSSVWLMMRHVRLHKLTILNIAADAAGLVASVGWALISPTAWALVAGDLAAPIVFVIASHIVAEQRVQLKWDSIAAKEILAFGTGMFLSSATYFLSGEAERLVVGKFINIVELGCFFARLNDFPGSLVGYPPAHKPSLFPHGFGDGPY
jgi:O-antigen/teichoic acid export membrane protein